MKAGLVPQWEYALFFIENIFYMSVNLSTANLPTLQFACKIGISKNLECWGCFLLCIKGKP